MSTLGYGRSVSTAGNADLNLKQVAAELGVHYMTAYRYVRTGRLVARRVGTGWIVATEDLQEFIDQPLRLLPGGNHARP